MKGSRSPKGFPEYTPNVALIKPQGSLKRVPKPKGTILGVQGNSCVQDFGWVFEGLKGLGPLVIAGLFWEAT